MFFGQVSFLDDEEFFQSAVEFVVKLRNCEVCLSARQFDSITSVASLSVQQESNYIGHVIIISHRQIRAGYLRALAAFEFFHKPVGPGNCQ